MTFLIGTWIGRIVVFIGGLVTLTVAFGGVIGGLAITGGPDDCTPGGSGPIVVSDALSDVF